MRYLGRRYSGWTAVAIFLGIALVAMLVLVVVLRKINPSHLTVGAGVVMLIYLCVGVFLVLASRLFVSGKAGRES